MFLPPTMLPTDLRLAVDPPPQIPQASDNPPELALSTRWSHLRSFFSWLRGCRKSAAWPCEPHGQQN